MEQKAMTFSELAGAYLPYLCTQQSRRKLRAWIERCAALRAELARMDYDPRERWLTPAMVAAIVKYLGEP